MANSTFNPRTLAGAGGLSRLVAEWIALLLLALGLAAISATIVSGQTCVGNCGASGPSGIVTAPPSGDATYQFVSTSGGAVGAGQLPDAGGTNGSTFSTSPFMVNAGAALKFSFNYVTSDGSGFADYAWAQLRTSTGTIVATLFTAKTEPAGSIVPGTGLPPISATLNPASVPIIAGAPNWEPLGTLSSGQCFDVGCGYTGWVGSTFDITAAGDYVLVFGVTNVVDESFDSGLAFDGVTVNGVSVGAGENIDKSAPFFPSSGLGVSVNPVFQGGTLRMDQANALYPQNFTLDNSGTNTIDQFGNASTFTGGFSDATPGVAGGIIIANSGVGGSVTFNGVNTYTGTTTIDPHATLIIGPGGSLTNGSTISNFGSFVVAEGGGVSVEGITNQATGVITNNGAITDALDNFGLVTNNGVYTADVNNFATGTIVNNGVWLGSLLTNSGVIANSGVWTAAVFNNDAGGRVTTTGILTATTSIFNAGIFNAQGITTTPFLNNSGLVTNNGVYTAAVNNFATGAIVNNGDWTGSLLTNSGVVTNNGVWTAAVFNNDAGGRVTTTGTLTATTSISNAGIFNAQGIITTPLLNNSGIFNVSGPLTGSAIGIFNNSGTFGFINNQTTTTNLPTTTFNGQGGVLAIEVSPRGGQADDLNVNTLTGSTSVQVRAINGGGIISTPIPFLTAINLAPGASVTLGNTGPSLIDYRIMQSGNTFDLVSSLNTSRVSATPTGIDAIVGALNTGFFQNASAFISEPPDPSKNQFNGGPWIRFAGGQNDVSAQTSAQNPGGVATAPSKVRTNFNGFQTGIDLGVANVQGTGWNTHLGVTAGQVLISTNDLISTDIKSQSQIPFVGIYGAVTGHGFFGDFQIREDYYDLSLDNTAASLFNADLEGKALAANAAAGYRFTLPANWFIEPSGAFMFSQLHVNPLHVTIDPLSGAGASLDFDPFTSLLGRLGARVGTTYVLDRFELALQPFLAVSVWREFAGDSYTNFISANATVPLSVTRIGTFGQLGLGVSGQILKTGAVGFVRADYRFGGEINGYALVTGLRYQF